jgi:hypothetical protein
MKKVTLENKNSRGWLLLAAADARSSQQPQPAPASSSQLQPAQASSICC